MPDGINMDLYSRNGFGGPLTIVTRSSYSPGYTRVEGTYRPLKLSTWTLDADDDARSLPVSVLHSDTVRFELWHRNVDTPFALRDVRHDQIFFVEQGTARLETDFGVLDLRPLDMVVVPRAVTYRLSRVESLRLMIVATPEALRIETDSEEVIDSDKDIQLPRPFASDEIRSGEQELVVLHGDGMTSYFYDYDPLPVLTVEGAPVVQRFNLANVSPTSGDGPVAAPPARLIRGDKDDALVFYLGARESPRAPVHHNADYDEIGVYACGPGAFGGSNDPGTVVWMPKGVIHQGPEEDVPEGYVAWLLETRANLEATPAGIKMADLIETGRFAIHPSAQT